jgi:hypothetical protein
MAGKFQVNQLTNAWLKRQHVGAYMKLEKNQAHLAIATASSC